MKRAATQFGYEMGMKVFYDPLSLRVVVSFRGRITVLPEVFEAEADAIAAAEQHCRGQGWNPTSANTERATVRCAWD